MTGPKRKWIFVVTGAVAVVAIAAVLFFRFAVPGAAGGRMTFSQDPRRIVGALEKVDTKAQTVVIRLEDGSTLKQNYTKETFILINGKASSVGSLRVGAQAAILATKGTRAPADYIMQGAWQCPPGGKLPRTSDPTVLQCPRNRSYK
jgi:hypothetical protein